MSSASIYVAVLSPVVSLCVAVWGFRRTTRADRLKMFLDLQERYLASSARAGRRVMHQCLPGLTEETFDQLTEEQRRDLHHALAVMETIAIAWEAGHVEQSIILNAMGRSFSSAMHKSRSYIDYQAGLRGFRPYPRASRLAGELHRAIEAGASTPRTPRQVRPLTRVKEHLGM
ncbi:DUF4760 domain-containing protein [Asanoa siamensis]|uniref:Uncharacterized protein n=1 Tax=Asanoa siamensis TaxID=926357 RepID=A0ABQ4CWR3_9ACTN|nr:hypothetical protein [Asanoa siamensis]GIF75729.1 hypothetical protein Asi02nite_52470 [Asanoa siamensis]